MRTCYRLALLGVITLASTAMAPAQITAPRIMTAEGDRFANLEEQLVNRLHATRDDQRAYIHYVVEQVRQARLEAKLVVAIERYALRRNHNYAFPFFEKALHFEAAKRGVALPQVEHFASTKVVPAGLTR